MSKPEPKKTTAEKFKYDPNELRKLWKRPAIEWVSLLNTLGVASVGTKGDCVTLCCPYHPDKTPSGFIHTVHGYFKCRGCDKYVADPLRFISKVSGAGYGPALETYKKFFNTAKSLDLESLQKEDVLQKRLHLLNDIFYTYTCDSWTADQRPESCTKTIQWLQARGIPDVIGLCSLGMLPRLPTFERLLRERGADEDDVTACKRLFGEYLNNAYADCVVYTYAISPEIITGFKLRPPMADKTGTRFIEATDIGDIGAFGILTPSFYAHYGSDSVTRFIAVEGEHDQLALYLGQAAYGPTDHVVIGLGGSGQRGLSFMRGLGFDSCRLVGDDDLAGSDYPSKVLPKTQGISFEIFRWPAGLRDPLGGKTDPDEAVRKHGPDAVLTALLAPGNYVYALQWALDAANGKARVVNPDNVQALKDIAEKHSQLLTNETERFTFAQKFEELFPQIPAKATIRAAVAASDTPLGFTARVLDWFQKTYQVTTWNPHNNELSLWHYQKCRTTTITIDVSASIPKLVRDFDQGSVYAWAKAEIGLPGYLPNPDASDATEGTLFKCETQIERAIHRATRQLIPQANEDVYAIKGQGIHLLHAQKTGVGYIVNGNKLYKIFWDETREKISGAKLLTGPVDGIEMFDLSKKAALVKDMEVGWTTLFNNAEDLCVEPPFSLRETFEKVHHLLITAFGFECQEVDSMYCAAMVFYNYLFDIIESRRMLTHISAEYESGKTSLLSVTANHNQYPGFSLCDHAVALDSFTQAGFYQTFSNTRLVAALDEMNDPNDKSPDSLRKQEFYVKCRSLATSGHASVSQGTQDGTGRQFHLYTSVITASGTLINNPMDESRFNTIRLKQDKGKNVRLALEQTYPYEVFLDIKKSVFLHALNMAPRVLKEHRQTYARISQRAVAQIDLNNKIKVDRFTENLMPAAAILSVIGIDGDQFIDDYRDSRKSKAVEQNANREGNRLIDMILTIPLPLRSDDSSTTNIKALLLNPNKRHEINQCKTGIYFDETTQWLALSWPEICVFFKHPLLRKNIASLMFELSSAKSWVVEQRRAHERGVFDRLTMLGLTHDPEVVSILNVREHILARVERAVISSNPPPSPPPPPPPPAAPPAPPAAPAAPAAAPTPPEPVPVPSAPSDPAAAPAPEEFLPGV